MRKLLSLVPLLLVLSLALGPVAAQDEPLTILVEFGGASLAQLREVTDAFTEETGIVVEIEQQRGVSELLVTRVAAGSPPDLAAVPRPGIVQDLARDGAILPLTSGDDPIVPAETIEENLNQAFIDLGTVDGELYGAIFKANAKSMLWYVPASFEELGVEVPTTFDELIAVAEAYQEAGTPPFAIAGGVGWSLTDLFEFLYVRVAGPEMYNKLFVTHEVEWTDPTVVETMDLLRQIIEPSDERLANGAEGTLATTALDDAFNLLLQEDQEAGMFIEGGFMRNGAATNWPELECSVDFTMTNFPQVNDEWGAPVVGGGDLLVVFNDNPNVREYVRFLMSSEFATQFAAGPGIISPNGQVPLDVYDTCGRIEAETLRNANYFVFDGSDMTPGAVGGDAMPAAIQDFIANPDDVEDILQFVEDTADTAY